MIDADPVKLRADIPLGLAHQVACVGAQVFEAVGVFRRDDEAEMMPVLFASLCESAIIDAVCFGVEHARITPVTGHAFTLQIGDVFGERGGTETCATMTDDARFDDDAPLGA